MGATFARLKNWIAEVLNYADLNAEIDNILTNLGPAGVDDYSTDVTQMRLTTDPGEVGTESLAQSLAEEIRRIRFVLQEIKGGDSAQWYSSATTSLTDLGNIVGGAVSPNRLVSGKSSANSSSPRFLIPGGSSNTLTVDGAPTALVYMINGTQYSIATDLAISTLALAPSTNNTCLVNDTTLSAQESSKWTGEDDTVLNVDTMGTEITSLAGKFAAFKIVHGGNTEYFIGYVKSSTQITNCRRGYFYDSSVAAMPAIAISDNDTITLMKLAWLFAKTDSTLEISYTNPTYSNAQPTSPNTGDYWYDITNATWKKFDSISWAASNSTLIGVCIQDITNVKGARGFEFAVATDVQSNLELEYVSVTQIRNKTQGGYISVAGNNVDFGITKPAWDITANLESGIAEAASTTFHAYVGEQGQLKLSTYKPYDRRGSMRGYYHPYENWRYVGKIFNNSGSDFDSNLLVSPGLFEVPDAELRLNNFGFTTAVAASALTISVVTQDGRAPSPGNPVIVNFRDPTTTTGSYVRRRITAPLSITVPSTATLGHTSAVAQYVWIYLIEDAGVVDIGVSGIQPFFDGELNSSTAISAAATSGIVLYSGSSHSGGKPTRIVGRCTSNQATAGTWASAMSLLVVEPKPVFNTSQWSAQAVITIASTGTAMAKGTTTIDRIVWRRHGMNMHIFAAYKQTGAGTVGTGVYLMTIPNSQTANTTDLVPSTDTTSSAATAVRATSSLKGGGWAYSTNGTSRGVVIPCLWDGTRFTMSFVYASGDLWCATSTIKFNENDWGFGVHVEIPILGWSDYGP